MISSKFKDKVYGDCLQLLNSRLAAMQVELRDLSEGAVNDSKSSAGDKHETGRAMMMQEYEKLAQRISHITRQKSELLPLYGRAPKDYVSLGSLITTDRSYIFIAVALGQLKVNKIEVLVTSPQAPLAHLMMGKCVGDTVTVNDTHYTILKIE